MKTLQKTEPRWKEKTAAKVAVLLLCAALIFVSCALFIRNNAGNSHAKDTDPASFSYSEVPEYVSVLFLTNEESRCGAKLSGVENIVIHYTANPGSSAVANRNFFNNPDANTGDVSSHFVIGLDGEIILCIPLDEVSFANKPKNFSTITIECCHPDESGRFNEKTVESLVKICAFLCEKFGLSPDDVVRHYDISGKICPKYYVENQDAWDAITERIRTEIK